MTLSLVGGVLGILGFGLAGLVIRCCRRCRSRSPAGRSVSGLGVTLLIGLFFGTYPAWKAAGLDPVEALRYE